MGFDLEGIDTAVRGKEFVVSSNDVRAQRTEQLDLQMLSLVNNTLPFLLADEAHEKAHTMYYTIIQAALSKQSLKLIDEYIAEAVRRFKQACIAQTVDDHGVLDGPEVDLVRLFNLWMTRIILKLVGIPIRHASDTINWSRELMMAADASAPDAVRIQADTATKNLSSIFAPHIETEEMKQGVCASILQKYADGEMDFEKLMASLVGFILVAADNPPGSAVALVKGLTEYPDQLQVLRENALLIYKATDEAFRWFTNPGYIIREVRAPCTLHDIELYAGDSVACIVEAVHQNSSIHPQPEAFMIERKQRQVRSFGGGEWACTGQRLARELVARAGKHLLLNEQPAFTFGQEEYGNNTFVRPAIHLYTKCVFPA